MYLSLFGMYGFGPCGYTPLAWEVPVAPWQLGQEFVCGPCQYPVPLVVPYAAQWYGQGQPYFHGYGPPCTQGFGLVSLNGVHWETTGGEATQATSGAGGQALFGREVPWQGGFVPNDFGQVHAPRHSIGRH